MTAFIDFGVALLVMAGWFALAIGVALIIGALIRGPVMRDKSDLKPLSDRPESEWTEFVRDRARRQERAREAAQRARSRRVV